MIQKIEDKDALYISFSKRRNGVYAKASDLSTLCGIDILVLIYSPTGRPYSFGSPTVESIANQFLCNMGFLISHDSSSHEQEHRKRVVQNLNHNLLEVSHYVEGQKQKKTELDEQLRVGTQGLEWIQDLKDVADLEALDLLEQSLWMLKAQVDRRVKRANLKLNPTQLPPPDRDIALDPVPYPRSQTRESLVRRRRRRRVDRSVVLSTFVVGSGILKTCWAPAGRASTAEPPWEISYTGSFLQVSFGEVDLKACLEQKFSLNFFCTFISELKMMKKTSVVNSNKTDLTEIVVFSHCSF
ncbi:agamous-like MADS-box protein AGL28 [Zingiber officinale]|uniref:agamous-like MADS-box protein AGL28 n=1 Tax=Zingiber officinale TaxID=94328 RepID=UPI001C4B7A18|nr:agamous-like MADS-box protein AGL28 [Zingiber officinale]